MDQVLRIKPKETVRVDHDKLGALYAELGEIAAEDVVCRAMEELALRLSHCSRLHAGDAPAVAATLARLLRIGEQSLTAIWDMQDLTI